MSLDSRTDHSTLSNCEEVETSHIYLDWVVDFDKKVIRGSATLSMTVIKETSKVVLDTSCQMAINSVEIEGSKIDFSQMPEVKPFGSALEIPLPEVYRSEGSTFKVVVAYATGEAASALQWLAPSQTEGKEHPYLFTQCEAIHARSLLPCADSPSVKVKYDARVRVPSWATALMSAAHVYSSVNRTEGGYAEFGYKQDVPVATYLIALVAAKLESRELGQGLVDEDGKPVTDIQSRVWCEPEMVDACAKEFNGVGVFLKIADDIMDFKYPWGRYDLICMPKSFPYGGMENPCLTFVTPTLLTGDSSLVDVVAHEIAHSWTGNVVTNKTWEHFWLNEGWTMWMQRKIMERKHRDMPGYFDFNAALGLTSLNNDIANYGVDGEFTKMVPDLKGADPDDSFSTVPYEKGFNFLYYLERQVGHSEFEHFAQKYVRKFQGQSLTSQDFKDFFLAHFSAPEFQKAVGEVDWDAWMLQPGDLPVPPQYDDSIMKRSTQLAESWLAAPEEVTETMEGWISDQTVAFLDHLLQLVKERRTPLQSKTIGLMEKMYKFSETQNCEIKFRWCQLLVRSEDKDHGGVQLTVDFLAAYGRMKYVRPLYKELVASRVGRAAAFATFQACKDHYHPIAAKMVAADFDAAAGNSVDPSTLANAQTVSTSHISLDWKVDFDAKVIRGSATLTMEILKPTAEVVLDATGSMSIYAVSVNGLFMEFSRGPNQAPLGTSLVVPLPEQFQAAGTRLSVMVKYSTAPDASALQWLSREQTNDGTHPYMFTQCQAIHARSLLPCADTPGLKVTYDARVRVPSWATALMSAVHTYSCFNRTEEDGYAEFGYKQEVPVPTYLIALVAAKLDSRELGQGVVDEDGKPVTDIQSRVWCEPNMVDACAEEFNEVGVFLNTAEEILDMKYQWGRYDLVVMPPSFPFGGMENPCLTFVTPTLLAGDRSLVDVVAHEIAHSWTGNVVTNKTSEHFWLNEGWTMWMERKIMERKHHDIPHYFDFSATLGLTELKDDFARYAGEDFAYTALVPPLTGVDPDDSYSTVPYEKGFNFLYYLERQVGHQNFESFAKAYVKADQFKFKSLTSQDFKDFFLAHFSAPEFQKAVGEVDWDAWMLQPGDLPVPPQYDDSIMKQCEALAKAWLSAPEEVTEMMEGWISDQTVAFLDHLLQLVKERRTPLQSKTIGLMEKMYKFSETQNCEIKFRWCQLLLRSEDEKTGVNLSIEFVAAYGRMKYVRPLYEALASITPSRARETFDKHCNSYHPIAAKMIQKDFDKADQKRTSRSPEHDCRSGTFSGVMQHLWRSCW